MARKQVISPPEEGSEAPEFNLPVAQGGQLRLGLRTARGPVIVIFYRGAWSEECAAYFKALAEREREINVAGATLVGVGPAEPEEAREFVRESGFKSYLLYDYIRRTTSEYGLLQKDDPEHGHAARPAAFLIGKDHEVIRAWLDDRPTPEDLLAEVSKITGLPKEPEEGEAEEKPKRRPKKAAEGETTGSESEGGEKSSPKEDSASSSGDAASESSETPGGAGDSGDEASSTAPKDGGEASQKKPVESAESTAESIESPESSKTTKPESTEESETSPAASEDAATAPEEETKSSGSPENAGDTDTGDSSGSSGGGESERGSMSLEEGGSESESEADEEGSDASAGDPVDTSPKRGESGGDGATSSGEDR